MTTLTEALKERVRVAGVCPTCHRPIGEGGVRGLAEDIGVSYTVLWRWLRGGDITGRNLDKVAAWLDGKGDPS